MAKSEGGPRKNSINSALKAAALGSLIGLASVPDSAGAHDKEGARIEHSHEFHAEGEASVLLDQLNRLSTSNQSSAHDKERTVSAVRASIDGLAFALLNHQGILSSSAPEFLTTEREDEFRGYITAHTAAGPIPNRQEAITYLVPIAENFIELRAQKDYPGMPNRKERIELYLDSHYAMRALREELGLAPWYQS